MKNIATNADSTRGKIKYRPILFGAPMVRAILAGKKTQTRRVVNRVAGLGPVTEFQRSDTPGYNWIMRDSSSLWNDMDDDRLLKRCPYGQPGDQLWVREAWARTSVFPGSEMVVYREGDSRTDYGGPWKPGIHMPRWASRITLEITSVRVERLQDISEADAVAEGIGSIQVSDGGESRWMNYVEPDSKGRAFGDPRRSYRALWEQINGADSWDTKPWVWVIEFRRVEGGAA